jgi:hypothetical protein
VVLLSPYRVIDLIAIGRPGKVRTARSTYKLVLPGFRIDGNHPIMAGLSNKVTVSRGTDTINIQDKVTTSRRVRMGAATSNVHRHLLGVSSSIRSRVITDQHPRDMDIATRVTRTVDHSIRTSHHPGWIKAG